MTSKNNYLRGKVVTLTGGTGFVGSHLLGEILKQKPALVQLISRGSSTKRIRQYLDQVKIVKYRSQKKYLESIIASNPDYLFLLGGNSDPRLSLQNPQHDLNHNFLYNFHLFETIKKKKNFKPKIIFISSVAVYGESTTEPLNERSSPTVPLSPYGINKLAIEGYLRFYAQNYQLLGFSIRLFSTYGPTLTKQVVFDFIHKLIHQPQSLEIRGDGVEVRDLTYIDDQVAGILTLAQNAKYQGEVYNLGSGSGLSVRDLAQEIATLIQVKPKFIFQKDAQEKHHGKKWIADVTQAKNLGHRPQITIKEGLKRTITWIKNH